LFIDIFFLFNSWLIIFSTSRPEKIFIRTPKKRPFLKYLTLKEKFIYIVFSLILLLYFFKNLIKTKRKINLFKTIVKFESWKQIEYYLNSQSDVDRVYITSDSIVPGWFLANKRWSVINKHAGDTSKIRGLLPAFWSLSYDIPLCVTVHLVDDKIDNGKQLAVENIKDKKINSLLNFYAHVYFNVWPVLFDRIHSHELSKQAYEPVNNAIYRSWPKSVDFSEFRKKSRIPLCKFSDILFHEKMRY
jgi:hypothetical protein